MVDPMQSVSQMQGSATGIQEDALRRIQYNGEKSCEKSGREDESAIKVQARVPTPSNTSFNR